MHLLLFCCCSVVASRFPPTSHTATQRQAFGLLQCRLRAALPTLECPLLPRSSRRRRVRWDVPVVSQF